MENGEYQSTVPTVGKYTDWYSKPASSQQPAALPLAWATGACGRQVTAAAAVMQYRVVKYLGTVITVDIWVHHILPLISTDYKYLNIMWFYISPSRRGAQGLLGTQVIPVDFLYYCRALCT